MINNSRPGAKTVLLLGIISLVIFAESSIPYISAEKKSVNGNIFLGQVLYTFDQDMYYSFIRQAYDGNFLFYNKLTALPNKPAFINLEFWFIGTIQRVTGLSANAVYHVWRYMGILLLIIGFSMLARIVIPSARRAFWAMMAFLFAGGSGFIFLLLNARHIINTEMMRKGIIDMRFGVLPIQQIMSNPNFSFPHGLLLIAYAFFLIGEKSGKTKHYLISGFLFNIIGLVRPYDLLPPLVIFPLYLLATNGSLKFAIRDLARRLLPLMMIGPVLIYNFWLFKFNDAFKGWSTQGLNADGMPSVTWHFLAFGMLGVLALIRVAQIKSNPLSKIDRFMVLWFAVTFTFIHLGKFFPVIGWSPQIGVYLAAPLAILGFSVKFRKPLFTRPLHYAAIAVIVLFMLAGNIAIILYPTKNFSLPDKIASFYATGNEMDALHWLDVHAQPGNVVVATLNTSLRIARYTKASIVAGHYSVTPNFIEKTKIAYTIFYHPVVGINERYDLGRTNADYIYLGPAERQIVNTQIEESPYITRVYTNPDVSIYKVNRSYVQQ